MSLQKIDSVAMSLHPQTLLNSPAAMASAVLPQPVTVAVAKFVILEFFVVVCAAYLASVAYHLTIWDGPPVSYLYVEVDLFLAAAIEFIAFGFGHYKNSQSKSRHSLLFSGFAAVALAFSFLLSGLFLFKVTTDYSRATFIFQFIAVGFAVLVVRAFFHSRLQTLIATGKVNARRVVLIGDAAHRADLASQLKASAIQTVGWFSTPAWEVGSEPECPEQALRAVVDGCRRLKPDDVLVLARQNDFAHLSRLRGALSEVPAGLHIVPVEAVSFLASARIVEFGDTVAIRVLRPPLTTLQRFLKRAFDLVVSFSALVILSPLLALVAVLIKLDSPREPVFFRQDRHGYNNETIVVFKFRSMRKTEGKDFEQTKENDPRVTRVGGLLRRTNLDELPQLLNVLRGEMSIVGPRPHAKAHNDEFFDKIAVYSRRHVVKPGMTGWAQVNGFRGAADLEKMQKRVELDLWYIDNWSFWLDIRIMLLTLFSKAAFENAR
jgi:Undecaprenyl-phosphate glucose phosphotransferase